jgi:hypothetical protein
MSISKIPYLVPRDTPRNPVFSKSRVSLLGQLKDSNCHPSIFAAKRVFEKPKSVSGYT